MDHEAEVDQALVRLAHRVHGDTEGIAALGVVSGELVGLKLRVAELEAMEQRARGVVDDNHPAEAPLARYILGEA